MLKFRRVLALQIVIALALVPLCAVAQTAPPSPDIRPSIADGRYDLTVLHTIVITGSTMADHPHWEPSQIYPEKARETGTAGLALLSCTGLADGHLDGCQVAFEDPSGWGFGEAALRASKLYTLNSSAIGPSRSNQIVTQIMRFRLPNIAPPDLMGPGEVEESPTARDMGLAYPRRANRLNQAGYALLHCISGAQGGLESCRAVAEFPRGFGFGEAAVAVAPKFTFNVTPEQIGKVTNLPVDFQPPP